MCIVFALCYVLLIELSLYTVPAFASCQAFISSSNHDYYPTILKLQRQKGRSLSYNAPIHLNHASPPPHPQSIPIQAAPTATPNAIHKLPQTFPPTFGAGVKLAVKLAVPVALVSEAPDGTVTVKVVFVCVCVTCNVLVLLAVAVTVLVVPLEDCATTGQTSPMATGTTPRII